VFNLAKAFQDPATRRVALVFFATWCAPCKAGIQTLKAEAQRLRAAGVQVVLVDYQDRPEQVRQYLNGAACPFPVVLDPFGKTKGSYLEPSGDRVVLPRTVLVGRDLAVEAIFSEEGDDYVDRIVAGR
jgi:thiol-disulfide isomerase/thioredoxin